MCSFFLATPASDRADPTPEAHSTGVVGTFSYRQSGTNRWRRMTLDPMEFIRRFLQHVLPRGLQKVRHYGFLGPQSPLSIEAARGRPPALGTGQGVGNRLSAEPCPARAAAALSGPRPLRNRPA